MNGEQHDDILSFELLVILMSNKQAKERGKKDVYMVVFRVVCMNGKRSLFAPY